MIRAGLLALRVGRWCTKDVRAFSIQTKWPAFPESPVTGSEVLAYSCAAARDLHPLPNPCPSGQRHANPNVGKERKQRGANDNGERGRSQYQSSVGSPVVSHQATHTTFPIRHGQSALEKRHGRRTHSSAQDCRARPEPWMTALRWLSDRTLCRSQDVRQRDLESGIAKRISAGHQCAWLDSLAT